MRELLIAGMLLLAGCSAHYGPYSYKGGSLGGYQDLQLNGDTYRITYQNSGLNFVQKANVDDMAMLRAAQLTMEKGFSCFVVKEKDQLSETRHFRNMGAITVKMYPAAPGSVECYDAALVAQQMRQSLKIKD